MLKDEKLLIGRTDDEDIVIYPKMANRHGLIAGATGTGKTTTLKVLAESFSSMGVPVFLADVKGDLASLAAAGEMNESITSRIDALDIREYGFTNKAFPVNIWDVYQEKGIPLRTTISEMGPLLLGQILGLNNTQADILTIIFKIADDEGLLLIDTKDLKEMIRYMGEKAKEYSLSYGNIAPQSLAAITRAIVAIEAEGAELFFGEPALNIADWMCTDYTGKGMIQLLDCQKLSLNPKMYSMFLLWMLSELFEILPEAGDLPKPKMVFFFDEAHMLFQSASKVLLERIEQVVKLIRSKGVGIYFITQSPKDIPDGVLAQLGNKIQHALHAYTPAEQKGLKAAAQGFRENPEFDTYTVLQELGTGEALVSVLDEAGVPTIVKKAKILPPESSMGTLPDAQRESLVTSSLLYTKYKNYVDNDSAFEFLTRRTAQLQEQALQEKEQLELAKQREKEQRELAKQQEKEQRELAKQQEKEQRELAKQQEKQAAASKKAATKLVKNVASTTGSTVGRELGKAVGNSVGGKFGKTLGGNIGSTLGRGLLGSLFRK